MTTTRRPGDRCDNESAAPHPRPKVERLGQAVPPKRLPVYPAFFAARMTSPIKVFGLPSPRPRTRPSRTRRSSSRWVMDVSKPYQDERWRRERWKRGPFGRRRQQRELRRAWKLLPNQPYAPDRRRRFYLAIVRSVGLRPRVSTSNTRQH